ncbi:MAG: restriction endonuclease [Thermoanaerobaculia bacterium]
MLEYRPDAHMVVVEYELPTPDRLPRVKAVKYVATRDAFDETTYTDGQVDRAYDALVYQIVLRTIHELFEADRAGAVEVVAFNGKVRGVDRATGQDFTAVIVSLQVRRSEFTEINLAAVDPKACFKKLKGVGSSKLHSLAPVPPIVELNTDDDRFTDTYDVRSTLDEGENIAAMDWEDFEHLIRELFELEFGRQGGQVKVTRASRDGGIDVVVFDPDPIRGGKIVIQAKRYTNTVGVGAVRDLYGAMQHEGAMKGILVTTSDYGPDAYEFVKDKPMTLINGAQLLHMLQRYGHQVRINLAEAKQLRTA